MSSPKTLLRYTTLDTVLGPVRIVASEQGIVALAYVEHELADAFEKRIRQKHPRAELKVDAKTLKPLATQVQDVLAGREEARRLPLDLHGTPFQVRVWRELVKVPWGKTCSYSDLAKKAGKPDAVRAVASACARNPVCLVVPCHRILHKDGGLGGYYYGLQRKRRLLELENAGFTLSARKAPGAR